MKPFASVILGATLCVGLCMGLATGRTALAHLGVHEQIAALTRELEEGTDGTRRAVLHLRRGEVHRMHRDWIAAGSDYRRARELDPDLADVDLCEGRMWLDGGNPARAARCLDRYLVKRPGSVNGLVTRARARCGLGEYLAAARDYRRALARFPTPKKPLPDYYLGCARALAAAGVRHVDDAVGVLDEGMDRLGPLVTLALHAVELEVKRKRYDAALARLDSIAAGQARQEGWLERRGAILEKAGRVVKARHAYDAALVALARLPVSRRRSGAMRELQRRVKAAVKRLTAP